MKFKVISAKPRTDGGEDLTLRAEIGELLLLGFPPGHRFVVGDWLELHANKVAAPDSFKDWARKVRKEAGVANG